MFNSHHFLLNKRGYRRCISWESHSCRYKPCAWVVSRCATWACRRNQRAPRSLISSDFFSLDAPDDRICTTAEGTERESLSCCVSSTHGPKHLLSLICIRVSTWMRSLGSSRANSSYQKRRGLPSRWHVVARALKTRCWMCYGRNSVGCSCYSSLFRAMSAMKMNGL